ncbi:MAG: YeeE/YedE family protein [Rhodobacteraceae bacterium]|nr:MAG: YeeE/YedE family protein [Paracoccaceae bacterium]
MPIDWIWGLVGGLMIGTAAAIFLLGNGRIMGASGLIGGLVDRTGLSNWQERVAFLAALVVVPALMLPLFSVEVSTNITSNLGIVIAGGLLVGIGTRLANGCTSGHGVCGISRFSLRGIVATVFYLLAGGIAMVLFRHVLGVI